MRQILHTLVFLAALAYGAMPISGLSAFAMQASAVAQPMAMKGHLDHGQMAHSTAAPDKSDCAHRCKSDYRGHCASCLTLAADIPAGGAAAAPGSAPPPALGPRIVSEDAAPLDPPPRA